MACVGRTERRVWGRQVVVAVCVVLDQIERGSSINGYTVLCSIVCIGVLVGLRCGAGRWLEKVVLCIASG